MNVRCLSLLALAFLPMGRAAGADYDLVVYGATPAGISACVEAKRQGQTAVLLEPTQKIGGMTTGGLGRTDIGSKDGFGGIAREFYRAVADHYRKPSNWTRETREAYAAKMRAINDRRFAPDADTMWCFEPGVAERILEGWLVRDGIETVRGERLDRGAGGIVKQDGRIVLIRMESGRVFVGRMFVDATYEGDLMAAAGVPYCVGREANAVYGETVNGIQAGKKIHSLMSGVDPYVVKGDSSSGLLPGVEPSSGGQADGTGDARVQAYCFRMCLTDDPENRIPFFKPEGFDEREYELFFRNCEQGDVHVHRTQGPMPNRKTDTNNNGGFSLDYIGQSARYPEAGYAEREEIVRRHMRYQQGLMWVMAYHPRTPKEIRDEYAKWGTCRDEFADEGGNGWPQQLYVREARRMVGAYVMTEHNCRKRVIAPHSVACASYTMDSHHCRRYVGADGFVRNEGDVQDAMLFPNLSDGGRRFTATLGTYGIDYGAIVPRKGDCQNLLVPVCLSASHIAYGSLRLEPVFFVLGQSAAIAAKMAVERSCDVQDVPYGELRKRLLAAGQVLPSDPSVEPESGVADLHALGRVSFRLSYTDDGSELTVACTSEAVARNLLERRRSGLLASGELYAEGDRLRLPDVGTWSLVTTGAVMVETFARLDCRRAAAERPSDRAVVTVRDLSAESLGFLPTPDADGAEIENFGEGLSGRYLRSADGVFDVFLSTNTNGTRSVRGRSGFIIRNCGWIATPVAEIAPGETVVCRIPRQDVASSGTYWIRNLEKKGMGK